VLFKAAEKHLYGVVQQLLEDAKLNVSEWKGKFYYKLLAKLLSQI
jgi:hypothetical protein